MWLVHRIERRPLGSVTPILWTMRVSGRRFAPMAAALAAIAILSVGVAAAAADPLAVIVLVLAVGPLSRLAPRLRNEPYLRAPHGWSAAVAKV